ncbi:MAG: PAS domain S-box protein [Gallionella sp.]
MHGEANKNSVKGTAGDEVLNLQLRQIELEKQNAELRKKYAELEESHTRLKDFYNISPMGYITLDRYGLIQEANHTASTLLGVAEERLLNTELTHYVARDSKRYWLEQFAKFNKDSGNSSLDLVFSSENGTTFSARLECLHIRHPNGQSCVRIAFSGNSSAESMSQNLVKFRRKADDKKLLLQNVLDHAPIGIWMLGTDEKIKFINLTFCNAVGISEPQFKAANHYSDLLPPSVSINCMRSDRECLTQEGLHFSREYLPFVDGKDHLLEITKAKIYDHDGQLLGLIGLAADITERERMESGLKQTQMELRELADKVESWREEERKRIAREVHDELGQVLTALRMDVTWLDMKFSVDNPELRVKTVGMNALLDRAGSSVRNIIANLRPMALDVGLVPALDWLCKDFSERSQCRFVLQVTNDNLDLSEKFVVVLFRVVQELLTNTVRHSCASEVRVALEQQGSILQLTVSDDGKGYMYEQQAAITSFGLLGVRERVLSLGGTLKITTAPQQGTSVHVVVPMEGSKE